MISAQQLPLEKLVDDTLTQLRLFEDTEDIFQGALDEISAKHKINARFVLSSMVNEFLEHHGIYHMNYSNPEVLRNKPPHAIALIKEAHHFARKATQTSYYLITFDTNEPINPTIVVKNVFKELMPVAGADYATTFFERLCGLMSKQEIIQYSILQVTDFLPKITREWEHNKRKVYVREKIENEVEAPFWTGQYEELLNHVLDYTEIIVSRFEQPSIERFRKFLASSVPAVNGKMTDESLMNADYMQELVKVHLGNSGKDPNAKLQDCVNRIEKEYGSLIKVDFRGKRNADAAWVVIYTGDVSRPQEHTIEFVKGSVRPNVKGLLKYICDYTQRHTTPEFRITTGKASRIIQDIL